VPDSPEMSTVALERATWRARARTRSTAGCLPMTWKREEAAGRTGRWGSASVSAAGSEAWRGRARRILSQTRGSSQ